MFLIEVKLTWFYQISFIVICILSLTVIFKEFVTYVSFDNGQKGIGIDKVICTNTRPATGRLRDIVDNLSRCRSTVIIEMFDNN